MYMYICITNTSTGTAFILTLIIPLPYMYLSIFTIIDLAILCMLYQDRHAILALLSSYVYYSHSFILLVSSPSTFFPPAQSFKFALSIFHFPFSIFHLLFIFPITCASFPGLSIVRTCHHPI